jgi:hypothetical protein
VSSDKNLKTLSIFYNMTDTPEHIYQMQHDIMMRMTPHERFMQGIEMIDYGRMIVENSIKAKNPNISERELVVEVFKRFYQDEFSAEKLEEICAAIRKRNPVSIA